MLEGLRLLIGTARDAEPTRKPGSELPTRRSSLRSTSISNGGSARVLSDLPSIQRVTGDRLIVKTERHSRSGATGQPAAPLAAGQGSAVSDTTLSTARARRDRTSASCRRRVHVPSTVARYSQPTPKPAHRARRPSSFSILRRSRLVGRPAPRSRGATGTASSGGSGGGLLSM
jgi:hypothetical protein